MTSYIILFLVCVLIAAVSQVLLKKESMKPHDNIIKEYLNPLVVIAYFLFFSTTVLELIAYKKIPLSLGPVLETSSYFYITIFGMIIFKEKLNLKKVLALLLIITGILIFTLGNI